MDYETVILESPCEPSNNYRTCRAELEEQAIWSQGELVDLAIPIIGGFYTSDNVFVSIAEYLCGNRAIKMVLLNHFGEEVDVQIAKVENIDFEEDQITCYYEIDQKLSENLKPGSYQLYVYLVNEVSEKTTINTLLTCSDGIDVTIF